MIKPEKAETIKKYMTSRFGEIEVDTDSIVCFTSAIIGFNNSRNYILIPHAENSPFTWLQSLDEQDVIFVVIQVFDFFSEYAPDIDDGDLNDIGITSRDELVLAVLVTIPENYKEMTANLVAPIIINKSNRLAKQVVIKNFDAYSTKEHIIRS